MINKVKQYSQYQVSGSENTLFIVAVTVKGEKSLLLYVIKWCKKLT